MLGKGQGRPINPPDKSSLFGGQQREDKLKRKTQGKDKQEDLIISIVICLVSGQPKKLQFQNHTGTHKHRGTESSSCCLTTERRGQLGGQPSTRRTRERTGGILQPLLQGLVGQQGGSRLGDLPHVSFQRAHRISGLT